MKTSVVSAIAVASALFATAPASAAVLGLNDGQTIESTTTPIASCGYSAVDKGVSAAIWQFVLGAGTYYVAVGGNASDSKPNDLDLNAYSYTTTATVKGKKVVTIHPVPAATLKFEELVKGHWTVLETLDFADNSQKKDGTSWATSGGKTLDVTAGTYELVFSGSSPLNGAAKFKDSPSFSGTVSIAGVPEVTTWGMMLAGFGALAFAGYRRRVVA